MLHLIKSLVSSLLVVVLLTGCWGRSEVNDIAIVTATGIDLAENGLISVSLLLAVPRLVGSSSMGGGGGESKLESSAGWVVSDQGKTVMEAYRNIQAKLPRKIFFSHNRVIIIGQQLAKKGIMPILDYFERNRQSQLNSYLLISQTGAAESIKFKPKFEKLASEIMREELKSGIGTSVRLGHFLKMVMEQGEEPYVPQLSIVSTDKDTKGGADPGSTTSLMTAKSTAVFKNDRLVGWLDDKETRGLMWVRNEMKEGVITVELPEEMGGREISAEISSVHSTIHPMIRSGRVQMNIDVSARVNVSENASDLDLSANITMLKSMFADAIKKRMQLACEKAQKEFRSDIFGFGQAIYIQNPYAWHTRYEKEWDQLFPDVPVEITVSAKVVQTGLVGRDEKWKGRE